MPGCLLLCTFTFFLIVYLKGYPYQSVRAASQNSILWVHQNSHNQHKFSQIWICTWHCIDPAKLLSPEHLPASPTADESADESAVSPHNAEQSRSLFFSFANLIAMTSLWLLHNSHCLGISYYREISDGRDTSFSWLQPQYQVQDWHAIIVQQIPIDWINCPASKDVIPVHPESWLLGKVFPLNFLPVFPLLEGIRKSLTLGK